MQTITHKIYLIALLGIGVLMTGCGNKKNMESGEAAEFLEDEPEAEYAYILKDKPSPLTTGDIEKISDAEEKFNGTVKRVDSVYTNKMYRNYLESKIFFTKSNSQLAIHFITREEENDYKYLIEKFYLSSSDSVVSVFFHDDKDVADRPLLVVISRETWLKNEAPRYSTDIFYSACGMHYCSVSRLENKDAADQPFFSSVKKYEDFLPAWKKWKQSKPAGYFD